jgi:hypothetical protein
MTLKSFLQISILCLTLSSCFQRPKACLNLDDTYETGREYRLSSCSENFDFLTWDFGDQSYGFIGETAPHTFYEQGEYYLKLTAYADGGYRSDEIVQKVKASKRYLSHFEVVGESNFSKFRLAFGSNQIPGPSANGSFTEALPYSKQIWPEQAIAIPLEKVKVTFFGERNGSSTTLVSPDIINFENNTENPFILEGENFLVKVYWTYN